jgi:hypothetical protein
MEPISAVNNSAPEVLRNLVLNSLLLLSHFSLVT